MINFRKMSDNFRNGIAEIEEKDKNYKELWKDYLTEAVDYNQALYKATFKLTIFKDRGADITQTLADIRAIPNITTVFRTEEGEEDKAHIKAIYDIKFILKKQDPPNIYLKNTLMISLKKMSSVQVDGFLGLERVR